MSQLAPGFWIAILYLLIRVALWPLVPVPEAAIHDEFSYLLAADTFAHGRLANPVHPMGAFFESPHIFISPRYMSMYQPGMGALLAVGQLLFGEPYLGVVLAMAVLCAALSQMLLAWTNRKWALIGGAAACIVFQPGMDWATSYMGGEIAAIAAAIALTAVGHIRRRRALWGLPHFSIAAALFLFSRPFEGAFFLTAILGVALCAGVRRLPLGPILWSNIPILGGAVAFQLYFNFRGTGSLWLVPYLLHDQMYSTFRIFWFLPLHAAHVYGHARLEAQHGLEGFEVSRWAAWQGLSAPLLFYRLVKNIFLVGIFSWLKLPIAVPFLGGLVAAFFRDAKVRIVAIVALSSAFPLLLITFHASHYAAPLIASLFLLAGLTLRRLYLFRINQFAAGKPTAIIILIALCLQTALAVFDLHDKLTDPLAPPSRVALIQQLEAQPGQHLVVVRYPNGGTWYVFQEWVYNAADPDLSRVVFAHDLGAERSAELRAYYKGRRAWLLEFSPDRSYTLNPL